MSELHDLKEELKSKSDKITENQNIIENLESELREIQKNLNQSPQSSEAGSVCSEKSQENISNIDVINIIFLFQGLI